MAEGQENEAVPLGFVVLTNPIRENAAKTFAYFKEQGVAIKVGIWAKSESKSTVCAACAAASLPDAIAILQSASFIARISFTPCWLWSRTGTGLNESLYGILC